MREGFQKVRYEVSERLLYLLRGFLLLLFSVLQALRG
jgi:hypothetical protein